MPANEGGVPIIERTGLRQYPSATDALEADLYALLDEFNVAEDGTLRALEPCNRKGLAMNHARRSMDVICLVALVLGSAAIFRAATPLQAAEQHHTVVSGDAVEWGPAPPSLPPGAQAAVLLGSPAKEGPFVLRLKFPAGFTVPPHRHSKDEFVTVISGAFAVASGEKLDRASLKSLPAASFVHLPAGMPHYAWAEVETVVQINGVGPFDVNYINPADDPRKQ